MNQQGLHHEFISPNSILSENGLYKLTDIQFLTGYTGY